MEKQNSFRMMAGTIAGIIVALTLTLNLWGSEWYKLAISTVIGLIVGLAVVDWRFTLSLAVGFAKDVSSNLSKSLAEQRDASKEMKLKLAGYRGTKDFRIAMAVYNFFNLYLLALLVVGIAVAVFAYFKYGFPLYKAYIPYVVLHLFRSGAKSWMKRIGYRKLYAISGFKPADEMKFFRLISDAEDHPETEPLFVKGMLEEIGLKAFIRFVLTAVIATAKARLLRICKITLFCLLIVPAIAFSFSAAFLALGKRIANNGEVLLVFCSITLGTIAGTFWHSYWIGLFSGLGFLVSSLLAKLIRDYNPFFLFSRNSFIPRLVKNDV